MEKMERKRMDSVRVKEIRERLSKATPGPWAEGDKWVFQDAQDYRPGEALRKICGTTKTQDDAAFIAHAPEDVDYLLTALEQAQQQVADTKQELQAVLDDWNAIVKAIGSPAHGTAIGHAAELKQQVAQLTAENDDLRGKLAAADAYFPEAALAKVNAEERAEALQQQVTQLRAALKWALGEEDEFRPREQGEGAYWWRTELRQRAFGTDAARALRGKEYEDETRTLEGNKADFVA